MKRTFIYIVIITLILAWWHGGATSEASDYKEVPVPGMVTMLDLGATRCIPCKLMFPIMQKIEKLYENKAAVVFIDVWENPDQARRFGIRAIPTQIFFDEKGKELYRHEGFMAEAAIVAQLKKMGVEPVGPEEKNETSQ